jgi:hypothetical protein
MCCQQAIIHLLSFMQLKGTIQNAVVKNSLSSFHFSVSCCLMTFSVPGLHDIFDRVLNEIGSGVGTEICEETRSNRMKPVPKYHIIRHEFHTGHNDSKSLFGYRSAESNIYRVGQTQLGSFFIISNQSIQQHTGKWESTYRQQKVLSHFPVCCLIDWLLMIKNCLIESGPPVLWCMPA